MADESKRAWLSPESYEYLRAELEEMTTVRRAEIARKIEAACSEGDLRESDGYQAAREERSELKGRVAELTHLLENATASEPPAATEIQAGVIVAAKTADEEERFLIGSREASDHLDIETYPESVPLGRAILGLKEGESTRFTTPTGRKISAEIVKIEPFEGRRRSFGTPPANKRR